MSLASDRRAPRSPRPAGRRWPLLRALRAVLCGLLLLGLVPGAETLVEAVGRVGFDRELHHTGSHDVAAGEPADDGCSEHGCTPLAHHCKCCPSAPALTPRSAVPEAPLRAVSLQRYGRVSERGPPRAGTKPGLRPPIA